MGKSVVVECGRDGPAASYKMGRSAGVVVATACFLITCAVFIVTIQWERRSEIESRQRTENLNELKNSIDELKADFQNLNSSVAGVFTTSDEAEERLFELRGNMDDSISRFAELKDTVLGFKISLAELKDIFERYRYDLTEMKKQQRETKEVLDQLQDTNNGSSKPPDAEKDTKGTGSVKKSNTFEGSSGNEETSLERQDLWDTVTSESADESAYYDADENDYMDEENEELNRSRIRLGIYRTELMQATWLEAEKMCQDMNVSLWVVANAKEHEDIVSAIRETSMTQLSFWISKRRKTAEDSLTPLSSPSAIMDEASDTWSQNDKDTELCPFLDIYSMGESNCSDEKYFICSVGSFQ